MFALQLFIIAIYPTLIQPLFNKVEPLEEGPLRSKIGKSISLEFSDQYFRLLFR